MSHLFRHAQLLSRVRLSVTPWTLAHQAPLSMGFSRQESWSGLPFPPPGDLPDPGIKPRSPALQADALPLSHQREVVKCRNLSDCHILRWHGWENGALRLSRGVRGKMTLTSMPSAQENVGTQRRALSSQQLWAGRNLFSSASKRKAEPRKLTFRT